jgi:hypothetical protein
MKPDKNAMYQGTKRFDREQLTFMVDVILCAAMDRIESALPQAPGKRDLDEWKSRETAFGEYVHGCLWTAAHGLAVLWAQTGGQDVGDGMGTGDAYEDCGLEGLVNKLIATRTSGKWKGFQQGEPCMPDTTPLAKRFVSRNFKDYLALTTEIQKAYEQGYKDGMEDPDFLSAGMTYHDMEVSESYDEGVNAGQKAGLLARKLAAIVRKL